MLGPKSIKPAIGYAAFEGRFRLLSICRLNRSLTSLHLEGQLKSFFDWRPFSEYYLLVLWSLEKSLSGLHHVGLLELILPLDAGFGLLSTGSMEAR